MPKSVIIPPGTSTPIAPFVPGTLADGVVYVSGTLPFDKDNNVVFIDDPKAQTRHVLGDDQNRDRNGGWHYGGRDLQQHLYHRLEKTTPRLTRFTRSFSPAINRRGFASSAGW